MLPVGRTGRFRNLRGGARRLGHEPFDLLFRDKLTQHVETVIDRAECFCIAAFVRVANLDVIKVMLLDERPFVFEGQAQSEIGYSDTQHSEMTKNGARVQLWHVDALT
jgi:hypothetical protein